MLLDIFSNRSETISVFSPLLFSCGFHASLYGKRSGCHIWALQIWFEETALPIPKRIHIVVLLMVAWIAGQPLIVVVLAQNYLAQISSTVIVSPLSIGQLGAITVPMMASEPMALDRLANAILLVPIILPLAAGQCYSSALRTPPCRDTERSIPCPQKPKAP